MATVLQFKRVLEDDAKPEGRAEVARETTGITGDGPRMFLRRNGTGVLLGHDNARGFLGAVARTAWELVYDE